eukprot:10019704-Heterocapsa_arctica.AAC.1
MQVEMDGSTPDYSSGRPYKHTTKAAAGHGSNSHTTQPSCIEDRHLTDKQIDVGIGVAFDRLLHSNNNLDPSGLTPIQKLDY